MRLMSTATTNPKTIKFGTKAQTLVRISQRLKEMDSSIELLPLIFFDVARWENQAVEVLAEIQSTFSTLLAVRSSATTEDSAEQSGAGAYASCLNVVSQDTKALQVAIETVIASYPEQNLQDQVLVQPMLRDIAVSGVITTRVLNDGAPYYVIDYDDESGKTDTITGGVGVNKTVLIHRSAEDQHIDSSRVRHWLTFTKEIEAICGTIPLDIEFAQTHQGSMVLFQVRPITVCKTWDKAIAQRLETTHQHIKVFVQNRSQPRPHRQGRRVLGHKTILGEMPDWNPAEIIGTSPRPLAASLYRRLITDRVWSQARSMMGYRDVPNEVLMLMLGGKPFIDVRNSFNSFLPASLPDGVAEKLVNAWLDRLDAYPELHDKVEFDIVQTITDFTFTNVLNERYGSILDSVDIDSFTHHLAHLTRSCLDLSPKGTLNAALDEINHLKTIQKGYTLSELKSLPPMDLLGEAMIRQALTPQRLLAFKQSIHTITSDFSSDLDAVLSETLPSKEFFKKYGHLRPGTYDILSFRYDQRPELLTHAALPERQDRPIAFRLTNEESTQITHLLEEVKLNVLKPDDLMKYAGQAIAGREYAKFIFTRHLSDALELIAEWGALHNISRDELSYMPVDTILDFRNTVMLDSTKNHFKDVAHSGEHTLNMARALRLSYLIRDERDVFVIPLHRSKPNFVTQQHIEGEPAIILAGADSYMQDMSDLTGKIVCIENADPGYDWIFTRNIAGLITKFGGSNSHMAIRCAEFNLPAAIGCGEQTFSRLVSAKRVELNCADAIVRPASSLQESISV